ncbi:MAG TPA: radical SAM protein [Lentisphaeria bacterium]|nr:MAG: hypothetical protein A2X45_05175 [Lentisphaerae bacterium GWF2_50_93]HCE42022.1 radical SAM protein [Lentisphaeria bacterium]
MYKYLFGPVSSRRLGISLGVDLVPPKTCSLDCIYCEAGRTTCLTLERREYYPTSEIIGELRELLSSDPKLDYITFSGAGEPTLHSGMGEIARFIKENFPKYRICLITNGTLLGDAKLAKELASVDLVIPSLDAADEETFRKINRPCPSLPCSTLINSLESFRKLCPADLWLEIFVIPGVNDSPESIESIRKAVARIRPDKVQLNSLDRPGTEKWVEKATEDELRPFIKALEPFVKVEIIGKPLVSAPAGKSMRCPVQDIERNAMELVRRRPCTLVEIASALSLGEDEVQSVLDGLVEDGRIKVEKMDRGVFYRI